MTIAVIGGTGHIGSYLVPRLVQAGYEVVCVSRGTRAPYRDPGIWKYVQSISIDREREEASGAFGKRIAGLKADIVIDLIGFSLESVQQMVESLAGRIRHYLFCGTIWVHGPSVRVPTTEEEPRRPFGNYGIQKAAIEAYLLNQARMLAFPATILHPGHIVGEGWVPVNPAGNFNPHVFEILAQGEPLVLPNLGMESVHHVHADDVAQSFCRAIDRHSLSVGESFHVVSGQALTLRGYAELVAQWFGKRADLSYAPWDEWRTQASTEDATATRDHIAHSPNCSIEKARRLLGYEPRYTSLEAVCESVDWLVEHGVVKTE